MAGGKKENNYVFREIMLTIACPYVPAFPDNNTTLAQRRHLSDWSRSECRRRANVGPTYAFWVSATSGDGRADNVGQTSAHGRSGRSRNVNVKPTLGQRMHFEWTWRRVMVGRATLAQHRRMVGLVAVGMSTPSQRWANLCILSVRDVGWWSAEQRWSNVGAWSDWSWSECRRRASVGPTYAFWVFATSCDGRPGNVGPTSTDGRIGRGRNDNVEPTLGQRMHFKWTWRRVMVGQTTLAQRRRMVGLVTVGMSTSSQPKNGLSHKGTERSFSLTLEIFQKNHYNSIFVVVFLSWNFYNILIINISCISRHFRRLFFIPAEDMLCRRKSRDRVLFEGSIFLVPTQPSWPN